MEKYLFWGGAIVLLFIAIWVIYQIIKSWVAKLKERQAVKKQQKEILMEEKSFSTDVKIKHDVRYTEGDAISTKDGSVNVTYQQKDIILHLNKTYIVGSKNKILPGKYTLLSVNDGVQTFGMRVNGIVSSFSHGCNMVFTEGDIVCPTSQNIILR